MEEFLNKTIQIRESFGISKLSPEVRSINPIPKTDILPPPTLAIHKANLNISPKKSQVTLKHFDEPLSPKTITTALTSSSTKKIKPIIITSKEISFTRHRTQIKPMPSVKLFSPKSQDMFNEDLLGIL